MNKSIPSPTSWDVSKRRNVHLRVEQHHEAVDGLRQDVEDGRHALVGAHRPSTQRIQLGQAPRVPTDHTESSVCVCVCVCVRERERERERERDSLQVQHCISLCCVSDSLVLSSIVRQCVSSDEDITVRMCTTSSHKVCLSSDTDINSHNTLFLQDLAGCECWKAALDDAIISKNDLQ